MFSTAGTMHQIELELEFDRRDECAEHAGTAAHVELISPCRHSAVEMPPVSKRDALADKRVRLSFSPTPRHCSTISRLVRRTLRDAEQRPAELAHVSLRGLRSVTPGCRARTSPRRCMPADVRRQVAGARAA
jgi:hypothetical protein